MTDDTNFASRSVGSRRGLGRADGSNIAETHGLEVAAAKDLLPHRVRDPICHVTPRGRPWRIARTWQYAFEDVSAEECRGSHLDVARNPYAPFSFRCHHDDNRGPINASGDSCTGRVMTETQGDLVGSAIVLLSTALLLIAVHRASISVARTDVRWLVATSVVLSIIGVATVILT